MNLVIRIAAARPVVNRIAAIVVMIAGMHAAVLQSTAQNTAAEGTDKLTIAKISPPNWFAAMPNPMLLIEGTGLHDAKVSCEGRTASVTRTRSSANGHWAMVWLDLQLQQPGVLHCSLRAAAGSAAGSAAFDYTIKARRPADELASGFSSKDVMYLIMPDRFADGDMRNDRLPGSEATYDRAATQAYHGGDLRGVIDHLDYIQGLGATAVWLTPVFANDPKARDYHGYHAWDLYAVDARFGTLAEYRELGDQLHRRHMKLIFDDVPNHAGPTHPWIEDPPEADWFHGTAANHMENKYVFAPVTDPHAVPEAAIDALDGWFVNRLPDMNQQNPEVAQYELDNMIWWIEEGGIDGLRIDTFPYVQREFWQGYLGALKAIYPKLTSVGEVSIGDATINAYFAGGRTLAGVDTHLDTPFDYPLYYALLDVLVKGKPMSQLEEALRQDWLYPHPEALVPFIGNHDQVRFMSLPGATPALLRLGFGLLMTLRGTPELYAGDEIAMPGGEDPDNRRDFPGGFPGDPKNAFTAAGRTPEQNAMHDWVANLGTLRARTAVLQMGVQQTILADKTSFAFVRKAAGSASACGSGTRDRAVLVVLNRDAAARSVTIPVEDSALAGCKEMVPLLGDTADAAAFGTAKLPAFGFEVYELR